MASQQYDYFETLAGQVVERGFDQRCDLCLGKHERPLQPFEGADFQANRLI
jgi:hypothetical protein